jgi:uncharacterized protein YbaR (Trm112 family)
MTDPTPAGAQRPSVPASLLEIIVCPADRGDLTLSSAGDTLTCGSCGLVYPVRDGIPVLLVDEARRPG